MFCINTHDYIIPQQLPAPEILASIALKAPLDAILKSSTFSLTMLNFNELMTLLMLIQNPTQQKLHAHSEGKQE